MIGSSYGAQAVYSNASSRSAAESRSVTRMIDNTMATADNQTLEEAGMYVAEKLHKMDKSHKHEKPTLRQMLVRVTEALPSDADMGRFFAQLETAMSMTDSAESLMRFLMQTFNDPGLVALIIQSYLLKKKKKKVLTSALEQLLENLGEDSSAILFSSLYFGSGNKEVKKKVIDLYHETSNEFPGIVGFYKKLKKQLRKKNDRRKAICTLLRSFSEDLHDASDALFELKIAYIIKELKRLGIVLTMDDKCEEVSKQVNHMMESNPLSGEYVMDKLVEWLDTGWIYPEMVQQNLSDISSASYGPKVIYLQQMHSLVKNLPAACFEEADSKEYILGVVQGQINDIALQEESADE